MVEKRRLTHTNWTHYTACSNKQPYQFRVSVELVGVNGSNPNDLSLTTIGELMELAGQALIAKEDKDSYECSNCGSCYEDHDCESDDSDNSDE